MIDKFLKMRSDNEEQNTRGGGAVKIGGQFASLMDETNSTLFVEGLSKRTSTAILNEIFSQAVIGGFKEVRHIVEKEVAFVEYEHEDVATIAMTAL